MVFAAFAFATLAFGFVVAFSGLVLPAAAFLVFGGEQDAIKCARLERIAAATSKLAASAAALGASDAAKAAPTAAAMGFILRFNMNQLL